MANQNAQSIRDLQSLFDPRGYQDVFRTWARTNERLVSIMAAAGTRSTDIASDTTKESLANLREVTQLRDAPADYGKAYSDFVQEQMNLFLRGVQSFADVSQQAGRETGDLAAKAGEDIEKGVAANSESAASKAGSAAKKAA